SVAPAHSRAADRSAPSYSADGVSVRNAMRRRPARAYLVPNRDRIAGAASRAPARGARHAEWGPRRPGYVHEAAPTPAVGGAASSTSAVAEVRRVDRGFRTRRGAEGTRRRYRKASSGIAASGRASAI